MLHLLSVIAWIVIGLLACIEGYYYLLLLVLLFTWRRTVSPGQGRSRFTILIPAHDEELLLGRTLASVLDLDYPRDRFRVVVIADNCTDRTAEIARAAGAECWERQDEQARGKGEALEWAFRRIDEPDDHAVVVLDADTITGRNLLQVFDAYLDSGSEAIQAANLVERTQDNLFTTFMALGNLITNYYVYLPKFRMGSTAFLLGTGMCFRLRQVETYFQEQYSISEDIDYSLRLINNGVRIAFAAETYVETVHPDEIRAASTQRVRWSSGTYGLLWRNAWACLKRGIRQGSLLYLDTAATLLTWSKALIGLLFGLALPVCLLAGPRFIALALLLFFGYVFYLSLGVILLHRRKHRYLHLLLAPVLVPWLIVIAVLGLLGYRKREWTRTKR